MSIRTGVCKHCGKTKEEHYHNDHGIWCGQPDDDNYDSFTDSGLASLHEHAEELYEQIIDYLAEKDPMRAIELRNSIQSILTKIKAK